MSTTLFNKIRTSYLTGTLLTGIMSNVMVFGQPIQQLMQYKNQLEAHRYQPMPSSNRFYIEDSNTNTTPVNETEDYIVTENEVNTAVSSDETIAVKPKTKHTPNIFYAPEKLGVIGIDASIGKENPMDNFFSIDIPAQVNLKEFDVLLKYDLYGVSEASQTTKSINNSQVYGGQMITTNDTWNTVEEYLPTHRLQNGENTIFFNRRADQTYQYKVKEVRVELVKKQSNPLTVSSTQLTNYKGKVYLSGQVPNTVKEIYVADQIIPVNDGVFEKVLEDVSEDTNALTISYMADKAYQETIAVTYESKAASFEFDVTNESTSNLASFLSADNTVNFSDLTISFENKAETTLVKSAIQGLDFKALAPLNSDVSNVTSGDYLGYRTQVERLEDSTMTKITLKYDVSKIPDGYSDKDVRTFAFDKNKKEWHPLPVDDLDYENKTVTSYYNGDTDYVNGVIKVPEMAETSSFTPTTITDMEYANPASGIVSIAPPSPNPTGTASTSFPIKLPAGRNGMMPSLSVNYNSEAGNGWMGKGWDMQLPAITLDTRWGAPRFDNTFETELYQLNGESLVLKVGFEYTNPHRHSSDIPRSANRTFYLRKEGAYLQIQRIGNNTNNYYWIVTDKQGNRNFYGQTENSRITNNTNRITHWALTKTVDASGNKVEYFYDKDNSLVINGVAAQSFYPSSIKYTLKEGASTPNYYQVDFTRVSGREDISLSARTGSMMTINELLSRINIGLYQNGQLQPIRSYQFDYVTSPFNKKQLSKISEYDAAGQLFYSNTMEYFDEVGNSQLINTSTINWNGSNESIHSTLGSISPSTLVTPDGSALGTSTSSGFSAGIRNGVGLGRNVFSVANTLGFSYNYSQSKEKTKVSFIDINGDGLPDKVFKPSGSSKIEYLPNLGINQTTGNGIFGTSRVVDLGLTELDETKSRTNTTGVDVNAFGAIGAGVSWSRTRTSTKGYFTDFNGDGLPDVVSGGVVKFNKTDDWNQTNLSDVLFNTTTTGTPNPISSGGIDPGIIPNLELETENMLRSDHQQFDHVKVWKAPYTGTIKITGSAKLLAENNCNNNSETNRFRVWIERATEGQTGLAQVVPTSESNFELAGSSRSYNINITNIQKGELLFFRSHNKEFGCGGEIEWNPQIQYLSANNIPNSDDENQKSRRIFKADEDFIMNNGGSWALGNSDIAITSSPNGINFGLTSSSFSAKEFSDDIVFTLERVRYQRVNDETAPNYGEVIGTPETRYSWMIYNHQTGLTSLHGYPLSFMRSTPERFGYDAGGKYTYSFRFYAHSDSNVEWDAINWKPTISTNQADGVTKVYYPAVSYETYDNNTNQSNYEMYASTFPTPVINNANQEDDPMMIVSHNMFSQNPQNYGQFLHTIKDEVNFPVKVNWSVKIEDNGVVETLHKTNFYVHLINCIDNPPAGIQPYCIYQFRTSNDPNTGSEINTGIFSHQQYFNTSDKLTKKIVSDLKVGNGKLYSTFYLDHETEKFGLNNTSDILVNLHPDEVGNYSYSQATIQDAFIAKSHSFYGYGYRGWGQFLYNGGVKYDYDNQGNIVNPGNVPLDQLQPHHNYEGAIDMSVFDYNADPNAIQNNLDNPPTSATANQADAVIRYTLYTQDNELNQYKNEAIKYDVNNSVRYGLNLSGLLTADLGRYAEYDIYELWTDPAALISGSAYAALNQRSKSKGFTLSGNVGAGPLGASGSKSDGSSKVLNQYIDVNGDRYPDMVTQGGIQFTNMSGGLSNKPNDNIANSFVSGAENKDDTIGVTISGNAPNSTASDNNSTKSPTRTNINSGINTSSGETYNSRQWTDMNGDGLTDKVVVTENDIRVQLNTGYSFAPEVIWGSGYGNLKVSTRENFGIGFGVGGQASPNASWAAGFGASQSNSETNATLMDVNGDGLPDLLRRFGFNFSFYLNNGASFETSANQMFTNGLIDNNYTMSGNIYGSYTFGFPIELVFIAIKVVFTPTLSFNAAINEKQITVQDIDGDGYPDVLASGGTIDNGQINARLNKIGKTHLLKKVNLPLGGHWTIDYERAGNTYQLPQNKWVLNEVKTHDGFNGDVAFATNETLTTFKYEDPNQDRREREFLGFGKVTVEQRDPSNQSLFRYSETEYHNENVYLKSMPKRSASYDASGMILSESTTLFNIMNPEQPQTDLNATAGQNYLQSSVSPQLLDYSRLFVAPVKTVSSTYEGSASLSAEQQFLTYDAFGNLLLYKNIGDNTNNPQGDTYRTEIEYHNTITGVANSKGFPKAIKVIRDIDNELMRERGATYNNQGRLASVTTKLNDTQSNTVSIDYDSYGNVIKTTQANGFVTTIGYENTLKMYPTQVSNTFNESSSAQYDYLFGVPVYTTDVNGQHMQTRIDNRGRVVEVTAPNEMPNGWTLRMHYEDQSADAFTDIPVFNGFNYVVPATGSFEASAPGSPANTNAKHHAMTKHFVEQAQNNELRTVSLVDGFGGAIQLKKTLFANNTLKWLISGKEYKDAFGRVLSAHLPTVQAGYPSNPLTYNTSVNSIPPTVMTYDVRDRVMSTQQPGETLLATTDFSIANDMFVTKVTNELGQTFETHTDNRGRQRKTIQNDELTTQFYYNAIGEKIKVRNHQGYDTFYSYDLAGRRIEERHPDYGLQTFKYDIVGNLIQRQTSNLMAISPTTIIEYEYDYSRLTDIIYPLNPENNVTYIYGDNTNNAEFNNAIGRLFMQQDASGVQVFGYDQLGNMDRHLRGVSVAGRHTFWYRTEWTYDSHNRVREIVYPDDEVVTYNYNTGGTLANIRRSIPFVNSNDPLVSSIQYNDLGERTQITYGNGTSTSYTYDNRRRLEDLSHQFTGFDITNQYGYDELSNVTSLVTQNPSTSIPGTGELGGPVDYHYTYDNYNRLTAATGRYTGPNDLGTNLLAQEYTLNMTYDLAHNILSKQQTHVQGAVSSVTGAITNPETLFKTDYKLDYSGYGQGVNIAQAGTTSFGYAQPHAPREIVETPSTGTVATTDPKYKKSLIDYDANGNQTEIRQVVNDAAPTNATDGVVSQQEMVLRKQLWDEEDRLRAVNMNPEEDNDHPFAVYTYDVSGQRVVRYIPGRADAKSNANPVSSNDRDEVMLYPNALVTAKPVVAPGIVPNNTQLVSKYTKHYYIGAERINSTIGTQNGLGLYPNKADNVWQQTATIRPMANDATETAHIGLQNTYAWLEQPFALPAPVIEGNRRHTHYEDRFDTYYYHSDHLGSSSYISNWEGKVTQHMEYLPYGETLVDEHLNSYNTPYKFNGKELDEETGNYYYGARYYNPKWSVWLSVDPLARYNPVIEVEFYGDGQHNGGDFNNKNLNSYQYCYLNPKTWIDPNGKQVKVTDMDYSKLEKNQVGLRDGEKILETEKGLNYLAGKGTNTCAIRLSNALNKSGYMIPESKTTPKDVRIQNGKKGDSGNFVLDAKSMANYLSDIESPTEIYTIKTEEGIDKMIQNIHDNYDDMSGIIVYVADDSSKEGYGATGHADLIYEDWGWDLSFSSGQDVKPYLKEKVLPKTTFKVYLWVIEHDDE